MNITASVKGVIQRGIAQIQVKNDHLWVTLTDGAELDLGVVAGRGITDVSMKAGRLILKFSDGATKDVGYVAGRGIVRAQVKDGNLVFSFSDGTFEDVGSVRGRSIQAIAKTGSAGKTDTYTITYTDGTSWSYTVQNGDDATFDGTLHGDLCLRGGCVRFQAPTGADVLRLSAAADRDGTVRLGSRNQPIRVGSLAAPQNDTDAVNKGYVDSLIAGSINAIDRLIGGNA